MTKIKEASTKLYFLAEDVKEEFGLSEKDMVEVVKLVLEGY